MKVYTSNETPDGKGIEAIDNLTATSLRFMMERHKYRTMWQLRSLEKEIDADGGMIIINDTGRIAIKGFKSQELVDKIKEILEADLD